MKNKADTKPAPAGEPTGGNLKLSEVIDALENETLEPDCKAILLVVDRERSRGLFDYSLLDISNTGDVLLMQLRLGITALASQFLNFNPEAMAAVAAAYGREVQESANRNRLSCLMHLGGEDGDDRKEEI